MDEYRRVSTIMDRVANGKKSNESKGSLNDSVTEDDYNECEQSMLGLSDIMEIAQL